MTHQFVTVKTHDGRVRKLGIISLILEVATIESFIFETDFFSEGFRPDYWNRGTFKFMQVLKRWEA